MIVRSGEHSSLFAGRALQPAKNRKPKKVPRGRSHHRTADRQAPDPHSVSSRQSPGDCPHRAQGPANSRRHPRIAVVRADYRPHRGAVIRHDVFLGAPIRAQVAVEQAGFLMKNQGTDQKAVGAPLEFMVDRRPADSSPRNRQGQTCASGGHTEPGKRGPWSRSKAQFEDQSETREKDGMNEQQRGDSPRWRRPESEYVPQQTQKDEARPTFEAFAIRQIVGDRPRLTRIFQGCLDQDENGLPTGAPARAAIIHLSQRRMKTHNRSKGSLQIFAAEGRPIGIGRRDQRRGFAYGIPTGW